MCNQCGGRLTVVPASIGTWNHPGLSGMLLACGDCGRPIRLLHKRPVTGRMTGGRPSRAQANRVLRAARRRKGIA